MALFYGRYSTWKGKTLHLEDLIVKKKFRKQGIGKELIQKIHRNSIRKRVLEERNG